MVVLQNRDSRDIRKEDNNNKYYYSYTNNKNNVLLVVLNKLVSGCKKKKGIIVSKSLMNIKHYTTKNSISKKCLVYGLCGVSLVIPDLKIGFMVGLWLSSKEMFKLRLFKICEYIRSKVLRVRLIGFVRGYL